jgi:hypothetical protein
MPLGQSILVRFGTKAIASAMGADPLTQAAVSRAVGWVTAHLTFDHHSQAVAEYLDTTHDMYNIHEVADGTSTIHHGDLTFGKTTEFPDGTHIENPHTDALGYIYKTKEDWVNGTNKHVPKS